MIGRRVAGMTAWLAVLVLLAMGCTATPPPASPTSAAATPTTERDANQIVIGVDSVKGGFNPHTIADSSTTTRALAQLMLPSVFRTSDSGSAELDKTLMRSAKVISTDPFTVAYTIRQDASWSDGAPIAAEDFSYLAERMRTQPGTIDPAGYRLISDVESRRGGKRVQVEFESRYPGWRSLFANLLPSHLLKDSPGGWQSAMEGGFPAYGGPFAIKSADTARGEILIERNERYWEKPAAVDQLVLRQSDTEGIVTALRKGDNQFAMARMDGSGQRALRELGDKVDLHTIAQPEVAEVLLRPTSDQLADDNVRAAAAAFLDRAKLIDAGAKGGPSAELTAGSQVYAPSENLYRERIPQGRKRPDPERAERLLTDAGYQKSGGRWRSGDGEPLSLVVASPGERQPYADIAQEVAAQLTGAGFEVEVAETGARELLGQDPADRDGDTDGSDAAADIVVAPRPVGTDPVAILASRFACRTTENVDGADDETLPGNIAGFCDRNLRSTFQDLLSGRRPAAEAASALESALWEADVSLPLFQLADTLAVTGDVAGVTEGPPLAGPFGSAVDWIRTDN